MTQNSGRYFRHLQRRAVHAHCGRRAYQGEEVLTVQQTRTIQFTLPENRIVDTITVGGQQVTYELNDDVVKFNVSTENNNLGPKNVVITLKEGVYADETTFTGYDQRRRRV